MASLASLELHIRMMWKNGISDARALGSAALHRLRQRVVQLHLEGGSRAQIVAQTGLSPSAISKILKIYAQGGLLALRPKPRGRPLGACRRLTLAQEQELLHVLSGHHAPGHYWTRHSLAEEVVRRFGVVMGFRTLSHYRARWKMPVAGRTRQAADRHAPTAGALRQLRNRAPAALVWVDAVPWEAPGLGVHTVLLATTGRSGVGWSAWPGQPMLADWCAWCLHQMAQAGGPTLLVFADGDLWPTGFSAWLDGQGPDLTAVCLDALACKAGALRSAPW